MTGSLMAGKAGLVTGSASGIGRACAVRLGADGAAVVVSDLESSRAGGEETVSLIEAALDYAVNNAGIGVHALLADTPTDDFDRTIAVNLRGTFLGMKHQIRQMLRNSGGSIVNMASNAGLHAVRMLSAYTASKHGIVGLTENAAIEYAEDGIRVNAVCPGAIMTPLMTGQSPERQQQILAPQAMKRFGEPEEVAAAVVWLCSDESSFVTAVALPVDAGSVAW